MSEVSPAPSRNTPPALAPVRVDEHAPAIPSPLNPDAPVKGRPAAPPPREQRERKQSQKKKEAAGGRSATPETAPRLKATSSTSTVPSPIRYSIPEPRITDYEPPKDPVFTSHEPLPFFTPDGTVELKKSTDHAENRKSYRYTHCIADPHFRHKQYYRQTDSKPYGPRMSFEDSDKWMHFDEGAHFVTNEKGWRMSRANVVAREGRMYYEVRIVKGVPARGPVVPTGHDGPLPHVRMGWVRREAALDAPVGFDGYGYGLTDIRFETMHRSRPGKIYQPKPKGSKSNPKMTSTQSKHLNGNEITTAPDEHLREGDVVGLEINLPPLNLHRKIVDGMYNPAVDDIANSSASAFFDGHDIIRDRIPVTYKGNVYFEQLEYQNTKAMDQYSDRGPSNKIQPTTNHDEVTLRSLPHSSIRIFKNGKLVGTAFENLIAFLPPASAPAPTQGARVGFDDGMLGYFPAVAAFCGGIAEVNFGPNFWCSPDQDNEADQHVSNAIGERYNEQIAEDILWDLIDEVDFFIQDGGYHSEGGASSFQPADARMTNLKEET